ncbi:hypothetical protein GCM10028805_29470 [Spirosoma harenae]
MPIHRFVLTVLYFVVFSANAQTPHIKGDIYLSIKNGTFKADLAVSGLPNLSQYAIRLNSGFNIQSFRDSTDTFSYSAEREYDSEKSYESFQYWFPSSDKKGRYLPKHFRVSYVGAFPVYTDSVKKGDWGDWKGNIAFNGKTIRASEQSVWYPILYDIQEDKAYQNVTFDLTIHSPDAKAIYLNGCPPQYTQTARFSSNRPFPLLLFAGDFDFKKERNTYLLNTTLTAAQADVLDRWFSRIKLYYEQHLRIPYGADITLLASTPVSKRNDWLFVTYPTIASVSPNGWMNKLVDEKKLALSDSSLMSFMAHELGHYYFGSVISPNSTLRWAFLEGITEYLSLQVTRDLIGQAYYEGKLKSYAGACKNISNFIPLKRVIAASEINEIYRYQYIPLLLTALERQIGREKMWKWLSGILATKNPTTNYPFFRNSLSESGVSEKTITDFENSYLESADGLPRVLDLFKSASTSYFYWGIAKDVLKSGDSRKPQAFYTSIKSIKRDDQELGKIAQQYFAFAKSQCNPANETCTSDFNSYDTLEEAQKAQDKWLKNLAEKYTTKQVEF